jgi:branched-chain amino acid transport system ATP-binding protein
MNLLEVSGLDVRYGGIAALHGIDLHVEPGEIVALLGANGAGKTTTLRAISGLIPWKGEIAFDGASLRGRSADKIARGGLNHVPEGRRIFTRMTVRENLELGAFGESSRQTIASREAFVLDAFPRLNERLDQSAATLSGGEQQMLAIGRALMGSPRLLMLDEPSLGLAPIVIETIFAMIRELNARGTTMLLVEQNARQALRVAHRAYVLESGHIVREGKAFDLLDDPAVVAAYLGG